MHDPSVFATGGGVAYVAVFGNGAKQWLGRPDLPQSQFKKKEPRMESSDNVLRAARTMRAVYLRELLILGWTATFRHFRPSSYISSIGSRTSAG